jgi:hypothetical protein
MVFFGTLRPGVKTGFAQKAQSLAKNAKVIA